MRQSFISRWAEELFPFVYFVVNSRPLLRKCACKSILNHRNFEGFTTLSVDQLTGRITEERFRAATLDEKTFKLTLSLSVALTLLGSAGAVVTRVLSFGAVHAILTTVFGVGLLYALAAGFTAVGALRSQRSYGYGTHFLLRQQQGNDPRTILADALARQETMNLVRHLRNEAAYQALRNGLVALLLGILIFSAALTAQSMQSASSVSGEIKSAPRVPG